MPSLMRKGPQDKDNEEDVDDCTELMTTTSSRSHYDVACLKSDLVRMHGVSNHVFF